MPSTSNNPAVLTSKSRPVTDTNDRNLLLTSFSGEVLRYFDDDIVIANKLMTRAIAPGNESEQFLATGELDAFYMKRGDELNGQDYRVNDRYVHVDEPIVSPFEIWDFDQKLMRPDLRGQMAASSGRALGRKFDLDALVTIIRGSFIYSLRAASAVPALPSDSDYFSGNNPVAIYWDTWDTLVLDYAKQPAINHPGGTVLRLSSNFRVGDVGKVNTRTAAAAQELYECIVRMDEIWDEQNVPEEGRYVGMHLSNWYTLLSARGSLTASGDGESYLAGGFVNKEIVTGLSGAGTPMNAIKIGKITVFPINNKRFPLEDLGMTSSGTINTNATWPEPKYSAPLSKCVMFGFCTESVANVIKMGVSLETERDVRRQSDFTVAKMMGGHDVIRPECCISVWAIGTNDTGVGDDDFLSIDGSDTSVAISELTLGYKNMSDHATSIFRSKDSTAGAIASTPTVGE